MRILAAVALALVSCKGKRDGAGQPAAGSDAPAVVAVPAGDAEEEATAVEPDPTPPTPSLEAAGTALGPGVLGSAVVAADGSIAYCGAEDDGVSSAVEIGCQRGDKPREILLSHADSARFDQTRAPDLKTKLTAAAGKLGKVQPLPKQCEVLTGDDPPCTVLGTTVTIDDQGTLTVTGGRQPVTRKLPPHTAAGCTAELRSADVFVDSRRKRLAIVARLGSTDGGCAILSRSDLIVVTP